VEQILFYSSVRPNDMYGLIGYFITAYIFVMTSEMAKSVFVVIVREHIKTTGNERPGGFVVYSPLSNASASARIALKRAVSRIGSKMSHARIGSNLSVLWYESAQ